MEGERVIVEILAVGVMNHGPSTVECPNREFAGWDFRGRPNKSSSPLLRSQFLEMFYTPFTTRVKISRPRSDTPVSK